MVEEVIAEADATWVGASRAGSFVGAELVRSWEPRLPSPRRRTIKTQPQAGKGADDRAPFNPDSKQLDGGGANACRDYPRGGASICALDRRGPE